MDFPCNPVSHFKYVNDPIFKAWGPKAQWWRLEMNRGEEPGLLIRELCSKEGLLTQKLQQPDCMCFTLSRGESKVCGLPKDNIYVLRAASAHWSHEPRACQGMSSYERLYRQHKVGSCAIEEGLEVDIVIFGVVYGQWIFQTSIIDHGEFLYPPINNSVCSLMAVLQKSHFDLHWGNLLLTW